jgi:hypothetical protein
MVDIEQPKKKAAGVPAVLSSFKFGLREMGPARPTTSRSAGTRRSTWWPGT